MVPKIFPDSQAKKLLADSQCDSVPPSPFPQGLDAPEVKATRREWALGEGAVELDMVINISALKSKLYDFCGWDIAGRRRGGQGGTSPVRVILETCLLTDEEKVAGCKIAERAGANFVKTSTATQPGGATVEDIRLMRATVSARGRGQGFGVRDRHPDKTLALYEAGARGSGPGIRSRSWKG